MDTTTKEQLLKALQELAPKVYRLIKQTDPHYTQQQNPTADLQLDLDVLVDHLISDHFLGLACVGGVMSEEQSEARYKSDSQGYLVAFDPLDGSSVVGSNFLVGSIFAIYEHTPLGFANQQVAHTLQMGAYILYGAKLELVVATTGEVGHYLYHEESKTWVFKGHLTLKDKGKNIAPGGSWEYFSPQYRVFLDHFFKQGYRLRYSGSMVADVHHLLSKQGGLFCYPATKDAPQGKLRQLFEVYPLAFVIEQAGGLALLKGGQRLLNQPLESLHAKSACFLGSKVEMEALGDF
ncbi:class 1 fructose-bisphosphatase [Helicobacter bizzozeronii]|uniref:class 1 fructose-bisphosphatase n=1 Tax=Helicobacter bizzozeronii TaxID=56877 RepID=UPI000CEF537F|nr:class 1 fructose-bisphosphatase [Helicobacter bizzozeronii]